MGKVLGNDQEAKKAIREMNGATIAGQEIKVKRGALYFKLFLTVSFHNTTDRFKVFKCHDTVMPGEKGRA